MSARSAARALAVAACLGVPVATTAAPLLFDFNGVSLAGSHGNGLGATGGNTAIRSYMNGVLSSNGFASSSVSVSGALATATYNGENHVKGPTLGTSDGGVAHPGSNDTFIINDNFNVYGNGAASSFTLNFSNFTIFSLSFDWEIFPDATCPQGSWCANHPGQSANWPDIELYADGVLVWSQLASTPSGGGDPQAIGLSGLLNFQGGVHTLTIMDWPAEVGIDNLRISGCANLSRDTPRGGATPQSVAPVCTPLQTPEPASLPLAALALGAAALSLRRARVEGARRGR